MTLTKLAVAKDSPNYSASTAVFTVTKIEKRSLSIISCRRTFEKMPRSTL
jgi:hypothetical protein